MRPAPQALLCPEDQIGPDRALSPHRDSDSGLCGVLVKAGGTGIGTGTGTGTGSGTGSGGGSGSGSRTGMDRGRSGSGSRRGKRAGNRAGGANTSHCAQILVCLGAKPRPASAGLQRQQARGAGSVSCRDVGNRGAASITHIALRLARAMRGTHKGRNSDAHHWTALNDDARNGWGRTRHTRHPPRLDE